MTEFKVSPIGKPRMVGSDRWKKRPCVMRYWAFKDQLVLLAGKKRFVLGDRFGVMFFLEMPKSWNDKKRELMRGSPHQQKPDLDNLIKAVCDCLKKEDKTIWDIEASKCWWDEGKINFYELRKI